MRVLSLIIFLFLLFTSPVSASRNITITSDKTSLTDSEEMLITSSVSGFATGEAFFVKGAFYKEGLTNYFGLTKSGESWIKNSEPALSQYNVKIGDWDNLLRVKVDFNDSGFSGNGNYLFKLGYYYFSSNGNISSVNWSENIIPVSISRSEATASPIPTQRPTDRASLRTPTPTPKPVNPPESPISILKVATFKPAGNNQEILPDDETDSDIKVHNEVLGTESAQLLNQQTPEPDLEEEQNPGFKKVSLFLIFIGIICVGVSILIAVKIAKSSLTT